RQPLLQPVALGRPKQNVPQHGAPSVVGRATRMLPPPRRRHAAPFTGSTREAERRSAPRRPNAAGDTADPANAPTRSLPAFRPPGALGRPTQTAPQHGAPSVVGRATRMLPPPRRRQAAPCTGSTREADRRAAPRRPNAAGDTADPANAPTRSLPAFPPPGWRG